MIHESQKSSVPVEVIISTEHDTTVTITSPYRGVSRTLSVKSPGTKVTLPAGVALTTTGVHQKAILIESKMNISVYVFHEDGYLALPSRYLGSSYYVTATDNSKTIFAIAPVEGGAKVEYVQSGTTKMVYIPELSVYYMKSSSSLRSVTVTSNVSIAIVAGHYRSFYSNKQTQIEYLIPHSLWGTKYISPPIEGASTKYDFLYPKIGASTGYTVKLNSLVRRFTASGHYKYVDSATYSSNFIESTDNLGFIEWHYTGAFFNSFMIIIPALSQYSNNYRFATPSYKGQHFVALMTPALSSGGLRFDGSPIATTRSNYTVSTLSAERYFVLTVNISSGWHVIHHVDPTVRFGLIMYGGNTITSYGLPLGLRLD